MKILLMGDASNYHRTLAIGLRAAGHDVTVASDGSRWMDTARDIDLSRRDGRLGGLLLWLRLGTALSGRLKGYDIVQLSAPIFIQQRPHRVRAMLERLRRDNGAVFMTALGFDTPYIRMCLDRDCPLRYNELMAYGAPTPYCVAHQDTVQRWLGPELSDHCRYVYDHVDGVVTALYEYHLACRRVLPDRMVAYGGIPVDISAIDYAPPTVGHDTPLNIMVACHRGREAEKGIDRLVPDIRRVVEASGGRATLDLVQNVPFDEFGRRLRRAHVVVDQLYSYTPATTALMAMASGKVVISGGEEDYYRFIGEERLRPVINADPADPAAICRWLDRLIDDPSLTATLSRQGRELVARHNAADVVARRFIDFWERRLG